jgi:uncharacterized protein YraI
MPRRRFGSPAAALALAALLLPAAAAASPAFTTERLSLRAGPSAEYPAVAYLEPGVQVEVLGCLEGYGWCDSVIGQERGWLPGAYLQAAYDQRREPLIGIAPAIGLPIVGFTVGNYWDRYYRGRPWYRERDRWVGYAPPPPRWRHDGPPGPGPGWRGPDRDWHGGPGPRPGPGGPQHFGGRDGGHPGPGPGGQWGGGGRPGGGPGGPRPDGHRSDGPRPDGPRQVGEGRGPGAGGSGGGGHGGGGQGGGGPRGENRGQDRGPPGDRGPR